MVKESGMSLKPSEMVEGGGLLDDVEAEVLEARFVTWDYQGKAAPIPALRIKLDAGNDPVEQYWSAGNAKDWAPSPDGKSLVSIGNAKGLNVSSNLGILLTSLVNAGFPEDKIEDDITVFEGMKAHWIRVAAPKRTGLASSKREDGRESTILTVDSIVSLPWEKGKGGKGSTGKAGAGSKGSAGAKGGKSAASGAADDELTEEAKGILLGMLAEAGGSIARKEITVKALPLLMENKQRNKLIALLYSEDFLSAEGMPWAYADGVAALA